MTALYWFRVAAELLESKRRLAGDTLRPASALQVTEAERRDGQDAVVSGWRRRAGESRPGFWGISRPDFR
ncbi:MAG: hypothetical protein HYV63_29645 [Candidatus Schekmanbacteria bacterium]|nr:hypothetical protein [Candidatus Schekmanbacteria bacterium]